MEETPEETEDEAEKETENRRWEKIQVVRKVGGGEKGFGGEKAQVRIERVGERMAGAVRIVAKHLLISIRRDLPTVHPMVPFVISFLLSKHKLGIV
jgi:hypothetical protein